MGGLGPKSMRLCCAAHLGEDSPPWYTCVRAGVRACLLVSTPCCNRLPRKEPQLAGDSWGPASPGLPAGEPSGNLTWEGRAACCPNFPRPGLPEPRPASSVLQPLEKPKRDQQKDCPAQPS